MSSAEGSGSASQPGGSASGSGASGSQQPSAAWVQAANGHFGSGNYFQAQVVREHFSEQRWRCRACRSSPSRSAQPPSAPSCLLLLPFFPTWQAALKGILAADAAHDDCDGAALRQVLAGSIAMAGEAATPGRLRVGKLRRVIGEAALLAHRCRSSVVSAGLGC